MYSTVLVANRGEIALRILNTLQEHNITSVILCSPADANSLPVKCADNHILLPADEVKNSYLNIDFIVEEAGNYGVDAIHPGYGFLSENVEFRQKVETAGIAFIGPNVKQMKHFGNKLLARKLAIEAAVPLLPGTNASHSVEELQEEAKRIGYPIIIKAIAGGGGRGIRPVYSEAEFIMQAEVAMKEAKASFGDSRIYVEKLLQDAKHVEVQILGNGDEILHFFERDCTLQRRRQKIIEEAPSPNISRKFARKIHSATINLASSMGYSNAGTVEFLVDSKENFYFMEVNTRIQVEHPVTEMITGHDLIWNQILITSGEFPQVKQADIKLTGHAIEARVYAENSYAGFIPQIGDIKRVCHPVGANIRVDSYVEDGYKIPEFYDSMIAKLIVHAERREFCIAKILRALVRYKITGIHTNLSFLSQLLGNQDFQSLNYNINYVEENIEKFAIPEELKLLARAISSVSSAKKESKIEQEISQNTAWKNSLLPTARW